ncbi:MAG: hypothetical protein HQK49_13940 [Oligoflexia bacterium]|nr:hypothetical protein [Oligoflexia bacterium]
MSLFDDPNIDKELVIEFCNESDALVSELEKILGELEQNPKQNGKFGEFGQRIDRIMGASKAFGLSEVATFCELGKTIGYKADQTDDTKLLNVVVAVLFDAVYLLSKMIAQVRTGNNNILKNLNTKAFTTRLKWLSDKFKHIERGSCVLTKKKEDQPEKTVLDQSAIDDLMKSLGL